MKAFMVSLVSVTSLFAQSADAAPGGFGSQSFIPMMLVMFAVVYFLMIKPEQKKAKEKQKLVDSLKKNDKVITVGGIHGVVNSVKDGIVVVKIAENTLVKFTKSSIASVESNKEDTVASEADEK